MLKLKVGQTATVRIDAFDADGNSVPIPSGSTPSTAVEAIATLEPPNSIDSVATGVAVGNGSISAKLITPDGGVFTVGDTVQVVAADGGNPIVGIRFLFGDPV
jgi:hypothetical protein